MNPKDSSAKVTTSTPVKKLPEVSHKITSPPIKKECAMVLPESTHM